jgi:D-alanyl-D-alanine carboxypeptidase
MNWTRRTAGVLLALGVVAGAAACTEDSDGTEGATATTTAVPDTGEAALPTTDLDEAMALLVQRTDGPIGAISVIDVDGDTTVHAAGQRTAGEEGAPGADDHVRAASLNKAMTGAVALSLVDDGVLSLDDTVGELLPDAPETYRAVTLRQLLTHTSGLPDYPAQDAVAAAINASPEAAPEPEEIIALTADAPVQFEPGERYLYTNTNPIVTALMIERATGESYADNLQQRVLDPLEMDDTYLPAADDPDVEEPRMSGYQPLPDGSVTDVTDGVAWGGWAWSSGGVITTPADLSKFIRGYVGGRLFDPEVVAEQRRFTFPGSSEPTGPGENGAGPAQFRYDTRCGTVYGHTGSILGYTQFMAASADGSRSVTFTISNQVSDELLPTLRAVEELAVCEALEG